MLRINRKDVWHDRDSNPKPTAWERCCPNPTAVIYFWMKRVGNFGLKKNLKKRKTNEWIFFLVYYICSENNKWAHLASSTTSQNSFLSGSTVRIVFYVKEKTICMCNQNRAAPFHSTCLKTIADAKDFEKLLETKEKSGTNRLSF